ncbi:hypothetical protein ABT369_56855 [Dactylosporangium sp. NPDC000244]|uniref:hypothetical protein n=1 Tax=Dactylosporangium sp. NPDC000244 TaxID=3154365 RepID=UPI00332AC813
MKFDDIYQIASMVLLVLSLVLAAVSIQKYRASRGIDFVLQAESAGDSLVHDLVGADPALIRGIYRSFDLERLSDDDCRSFPFMYGTYIHVSRMYFILSNSKLDYGLTGEDRDQLISAWVNDLSAFKGHPAMEIVHEKALSRRNFNAKFIELADRILVNSATPHPNGGGPAVTGEAVEGLSGEGVR